MVRTYDTQSTKSISTRLSPDILSPVPFRFIFWQFLRFGIVGIYNTSIDIFVLNLFLWRFPTHNTTLLLSYNSLAFILGALNSYVLNKYWTFRQKRSITRREVVRFAIVTALGLLCSDIIFWLVARSIHPFIANTILWANIAKICAVIGTATISYIGMRFWVFAKTNYQEENVMKPNTHDDNALRNSLRTSENSKNTFFTSHSLSVVLPVHNEEEVIAKTLHNVVDTLTLWVKEFEVIVINDGSKDATKAIIESIIAVHPCVRIINHSINRGYGAALVSGFEAVSKELVFFTDSDGQFDLHDLAPFFPLIDIYDAVLGYRVHRQDTWIRRFNAYGWKVLVSSVFDLHVHDVDCAFKLYRADFFHEHRLETRGAMINTEILYKLKRFGYTYTQLGVRHLPRKSGRATGAKLSVIIRAFHELYFYAQKWHREEQQEKCRLS